MDFYKKRGDIMLIGHWPLIGNTNDYSGYNNDGTPTSITYVAGKIGQAASFNGTSSGITSPALSEQTNSALSFFAWVYFDGTGAYPGIWGHYGPSSNNCHFELTTSNTVLRLRLGAVNFTTSNIPDTNTWVHLGFTSDGVNHKIYKNGVQIESFTGATGTILGTGNNLIGISDTTRHWDGLMNDVRIYDHVVSDMEIQELSKAKILHYQFNNPQEEPTTNLLGNGQFNNGTNVTQFSSAASYGLYEVIELENPGASLHVLRQRTGEYEMIVSGLSPNTIYTLSCWVAYTNDWNGNNLIFHSRAFGTPANTSIDGAPDGTLQTVVLGGLTWSKQYAFITTPATTTTSFSWYLGYSNSDATVGYRYYTNLQIEAKNHATPFVNGTRTGIALDSSGYEYNSDTISLGTSPDYILTSKIGPSATSYTTGRYLTIPLSLTPTVFTLSFWANFTEYSYMTVCTTSGSQFQFKWRISGQTPYFNIYDGSVFNSVDINTTPPLNEWHMYSITYDGTNVRTYYDGELKQTTNVGAKTFQPITNFATSPSTGEVLKGSLDDIRIYTEPLSNSDILSLYERRAAIDNIGNVYADEISEITTGNPNFNSKGISEFVDYSNVGISDGIKAYWPLDEDSQDYSGNEYNLTPVNSPTIEDGAHYFNGTNQYLTIAHTTELNPSTGNFSYSFSFKSPTLRAGQLFGKRTPGGGNMEMQLSNTGIVYTFMANTTGTSASVTINSGYTADTWHHYSVTRNGTAVKVYIDGVERGTTTLAAGFDISPTSAFEIGRDVGNALEYFQGYIKDFKYFTRVLSPEEVNIEHKISIVDNVKSLISNDKKLYFKGEIFEAL
jgi:hypothetical protein